MHAEPPKLIVNADDFGYSESVNRAIAECFARGYCTSTTIMANMPGFEAACEMAREQGFAAHVGVHFVLTQGEPLTSAIRHCPRFCGPDGRFRLTRKERVWRLNALETSAVAEELRAQVARCRQHGLPLSHADSHQHVHEEWGILPVVMRVCQEEGICRIRIARNCGQSTGALRTSYRSLVNHRLRRAGLARSDLFGSLADFLTVRQSSPNLLTRRRMEVMIHPRYAPGGSIADHTPPGTYGVSLDDTLRVWFSEPCAL
jgi:predicted glycoside hydrolase/deacetylase ChbG (UPF0249 family)